MMAMANIPVLSLMRVHTSSSKRDFPCVQLPHNKWDEAPWGHLDYPLAS